MSSCFSRCLRVPIAIRAFYEAYLWILQTLLLTHPDLHPGLIDVIGRLRDEAAVPAHHLRRVFHRPQHGPAIISVHGLRLEQKRSHDAEVAASAAHRPEQVGIFLGTGGDKPPVGEHHFEQPADCR